MLLFSEAIKRYGVGIIDGQGEHIYIIIKQAKITEVGQKYGITYETIRYYEREGLIPPIPKNQSGIRDFDETSCKWVEIALCMRNAGVGIDTLKKYAQLLKTGRYKEDGKELLSLERDALHYKLEQIQKSLKFLDYSEIFEILRLYS